MVIKILWKMTNWKIYSYLVKFLNEVGASAHDFCVRLCCAAALSATARVCVCHRVCSFLHCCVHSRSQASYRKTTTSSGSEICFVHDCKSQSLCTCAVFVCVFARVKVCMSAQAHLCRGVSMCVIVPFPPCGLLCVVDMGVWSLWSWLLHGETDFLSLLWGQRGALRLTNLTSKFNILLFPLTNTGLQELVCSGFLKANLSLTCTV